MGSISAWLATVLSALEPALLARGEESWSGVMSAVYMKQICDTCMTSHNFMPHLSVDVDI